ncbi:hypothetical protein LEN_0945 [Lysobacter enzymogenes]|uniref:Uncharacterized protein n=1 Tax=Lysobacter enzymogenes TaxID=69 RepID=A0AAU9ANR6_LYSEN|nr:hypothetical protein LEN_0945 [Lysobacter enzymogenes]
MVSIVTDLPGASEGADRLPAAAGLAAIRSIVGQARPVAEGGRAMGRIRQSRASLRARGAG